MIPSVPAQASEAPLPLTFSYAPRLTHDTIAHLSARQKEQALHECLDLLTTVKQHIYNPAASPQTRILALATIFERASYTARGRNRTITDQTPLWIGDKAQEGSMVDRLGISRNAIGNEFKAWEQAGLAKRFYRTSDDGNQHVDLSISPDLLTRPDLLPAKGDRPRKAPVLCQACGSLNLVKHTKTRIVCPDCGTVHAEQEHESYLNQQDSDEQAEADSRPMDAPSAPSDEQSPHPLCTREVQRNREKNCTQEVQHDSSIPDELSSSAPMHNEAAPHIAVLKHQRDDAVLRSQEPTPPSEGEMVGSDVETTDTQRQEEAPTPCDEEAERSARLEAAAALLVEMAGPSPLHICMNRRDKHGHSLKYGPVFRCAGYFGHLFAKSEG